MATIVTDTNLEETLKTDKLVILDMYADWCGPCKMIGPIIEELHAEYVDIVVGKVNVDDNSETSLKYGVRNIPTVLFIKNGEVIDKIVGAAPKSEFVKKIESNK
jgi:thioredoxin 1